MSPTTASLIGALAFLLMGIAEYLVFMRAAYPAIRERQEVAKTSLNDGKGPSWIITVIKFQSFVLMPVLGYFLGGQILYSLMGPN